MNCCIHNCLCKYFSSYHIHYILNIFEKKQKVNVNSVLNSIENNDISSEEVVNSLKLIANSSEGNEVLISYKGESAVADIVLPSDFSVKLDDSSIKALGKRFGSENVKFVYHSQYHIN